MTFRGSRAISTAMYPVLLPLLLAVFAIHPNLAWWLLALLGVLLLRRLW